MSSLDSSKKKTEMFRAGPGDGSASSPLGGSASSPLGGSASSPLGGSASSPLGLAEGQDELDRQVVALEQQSAQLQVIAEVARVAGATLEPDRLAEQIVELIRERLDLYYVGLFFVDQEGRWTGESEDLGGSAIGWCVSNAQARFELDPPLPDARSGVVLPLVSRNQVLGAMTLQSCQEAAFSKRQLPVLQALADQVASAVENARLFARMQVALDETAALYTASRRLAAAESLQEIVAAVAEGVPVSVIDRAVLWFLERDTQQQGEAFVAAANWHNGQGPAPLPVGTRFPLEQFPATALAVETEPLFLSDIQSDERLDERTRAVFQQRRARSAALLPLWAGGRQSGLLMLVGEVPYRFTENEIRPYRSLAGQMAILVENRRLLQQAQRRAARLEWLALIESTLSMANDEADILTAISMGVDLDNPVSRILLRYVDTDQDGQPVTLHTVASWYDGLPVLPAGSVIVPDDPSLGQRFPAKDDATADLWLKAPSETLFIEDVESDSRVDERMRAQVVGQGFCALALMPLHSGNRWQGLVTFLWETPHTFSLEERHHLQELSKPAAAAVTNRRAYVAQQQAREVSERRALRLQAAAEVSRTVNSILEPKALLQRVVDLVRERFDLYYAGLFLVDPRGEWSDEPGEWAVLRAGTGEAGQQMVAQGHKLRVGGESMIGACVAGAEARIAFDVGQEAVRFDNPFLPKTRSEMALPLTARGQAIGAMTIQSTQASAFSDEDITVLQTMADQVAIAIDNARLLEQTRRRAERERQVRTITDRVRRAPDREMILRTVLQELGQMLGASESVIQLGTREQLLERASTHKTKGT